MKAPKRAIVEDGEWSGIGSAGLHLRKDFRFPDSKIYSSLLELFLLGFSNVSEYVTFFFKSFTVLFHRLFLLFQANKNGFI